MFVGPWQHEREFLPSCKATIRFFLSAWSLIFTPYPCMALNVCNLFNYVCISGCIASNEWTILCAWWIGQANLRYFPIICLQEWWNLREFPEYSISWPRFDPDIFSVQVLSFTARADLLIADCSARNRLIDFWILINGISCLNFQWNEIALYEYLS